MRVEKIKLGAGLKLSKENEIILIKNLDNASIRVGIKADISVKIERVGAEDELISNPRE